MLIVNVRDTLVLGVAAHKFECLLSMGDHDFCTSEPPVHNLCCKMEQSCIAPKIQISKVLGRFGPDSNKLI